MEAGDLITAQKDGTNYVSPVMRAGLKWHGAGTVTVESNGQEKRDPLSVVSQRKYSGGGGGYWNSKKAFTRIAQNDNEILLEAQERKTADSGLKGSIKVQSDRIDLVVEGTGSNAHIKPTSIVAAINNSESSVKISADHIILDGHTVAQSLEGEEIDCDVIHASHSTFGTVTGDDILLWSSSGNHESMRDGLKTAIVSGNTLRIYDWRGNEVVNFSKATILSGSWNSGVFTVTASGATPLTTTLTNTGHWGNASSGEDENTYYYETYATINSSGVPATTGNVTTISGLARYNAGYTDGRASVKTMTPTAINVYASQQGTLLSTRLSESILTAGKFITMKVGTTTYSIQII